MSETFEVWVQTKTRLQANKERRGVASDHLIRQDAVDAVVVQVDEPVEALQLVLPHLPELDARRLHRQPVRVLHKRPMRKGQHE
jgi:hypothetical protein